MFQKHEHYRPFFFPEIALFGGWVGGWMGGWVGYDILPLSIFLIFKYDNKRHKPVPKMCLKIVFAY